jgi:hypothetical protein
LVPICPTAIDNFTISPFACENEAASLRPTETFLRGPFTKNGMMDSRPGNHIEKVVGFVGPIAAPMQA